MIKKSGQWWSTKYIKPVIKLRMKCGTNTVTKFSFIIKI